MTAILAFLVGVFVGFSLVCACLYGYYRRTRTQVPILAADEKQTDVLFELDDGTTHTARIEWPASES